VITSILIGSSLAGTYYYVFQKTAWRGSYRSLSSGLFWGLGGFILRLFSILLIFFALARVSTLHISSVIVAFAIIFSVLLFQGAGKTIFSELKSFRKPPARQPMRRI
jgi:hypothetical protein